MRSSGVKKQQREMYLSILCPALAGPDSSDAYMLCPDGDFKGGAATRNRVIDGGQ